ncbi:MAG TPA: nicotinate-nucleotide adenylyltransferase [Gammaproteobacteria bacterium]|jgi:nicotinate-nucleotide adenylyltransferase|nr:nicotinate-nucleotide adenylyltransferase [Gammaproteobacteria bacterium]
MNQLEQAIGILGGTFDPIHHGHLRFALELHQTLQLARVHMTPCYEPVHRDMPLASPTQRLAMLKAAIAGEPALYADDREIRRQTPSYTIDTLVELRKELPNTPLCLLLGLDTFLEFITWERASDILKFAHLVVAHRPQYTLPETGPLVEFVNAHLITKEAISQTLAGGIFFAAPITALEISASEIRRQINMGCNPRYLLPDPVYHYITQHHIYGHCT